MQSQITNNRNELAKSKLAEQKAKVRNWLESDSFKSQIASALPKLCTPERFMRVLFTSIQKVPKLIQCTQTSLFQALMNCAALGIEPDGRRAHLIPYENRNAGTTECQLIIDYKGLLELVKRSGDVSSAYADKVCENDFFKWKDGDVSHEINFLLPRGKAYAYYARVRHKDGTFTSVVMTKDEIEAIRKRSRAAMKGPWVTDFDEMAKKTAFRRLTKWLVLSPEVAEVLDAAEKSEFGEKQAVQSAGKSVSDLIQSAQEIDAEVVDEEAIESPEIPAAEPAHSESLAEHVRKQIEAERAAAIAKSRERTSDLGIVVEGTPTVGDCRPD
jgi:recombination protein RecT